MSDQHATFGCRGSAPTRTTTGSTPSPSRPGGGPSHTTGGSCGTVGIGAGFCGLGKPVERLSVIDGPSRSRKMMRCPMAGGCAEVAAGSGIARYQAAPSTAPYGPSGECDEDLSSYVGRRAGAAIPDPAGRQPARREDPRADVLASVSCRRGSRRPPSRRRRRWGRAGSVRGAGEAQAVLA